MAGSSIAPGRIEFVILRTGRSPPAAPHYASLRRSCIRLQVGERFPGEDSHLSDYSRFQAHHPVATAPGSDFVRRCSGGLRQFDQGHAEQ
jgi:hypothetical protein